MARLQHSQRSPGVHHDLAIQLDDHVLARHHHDRRPGVVPYRLGARSLDVLMHGPIIAHRCNVRRARTEPDPPATRTARIEITGSPWGYVPGLGAALVAELPADAAAVGAAVVGVLLTEEPNDPGADLDPGRVAEQLRSTGAPWTRVLPRDRGDTTTNSSAESWRTAASKGSSPASRTSPPARSRRYDRRQQPDHPSDPRPRLLPGSRIEAGGSPPRRRSWVVVTGGRRDGWPNVGARGNSVAGGARRAGGRAPPVGACARPRTSDHSPAPRSTRMCRDPVTRRCSHEVRGTPRVTSGPAGATTIRDTP